MQVPQTFINGIETDEIFFNGNFENRVIVVATERGRQQLTTHDIIEFRWDLTERSYKTLTLLYTGIKELAGSGYFELTGILGRVESVAELTKFTLEHFEKLQDYKK